MAANPLPQAPRHQCDMQAAAGEAGENRRCDRSGDIDQEGRDCCRERQVRRPAVRRLGDHEHRDQDVAEAKSQHAHEPEGGQHQVREGDPAMVHQEQHSWSMTQVKADEPSQTPSARAG